MDEFARLVSQIGDRFPGGMTVTVRPGVVLCCFGGNVSLEIRIGEHDRFDCTLLHPVLPVTTVQATSRIVLLMLGDLCEGRPEACTQRGLRTMRLHPHA